MNTRTDESFDLIRVLLVDDMPDGLTRPTPSDAPDVPWMQSSYKK